jgi:hypothetical protein
LTVRLNCDKLLNNKQVACQLVWLAKHAQADIKGGVEMAETGYCVKCKASKEMKNVENVTMKNGRPAAKGKCPDCGTGMYKILGKK